MAKRSQPKKELYIAGRKWCVEFLVNVLDDDGNSVNGTCDKEQGKIEVSTKTCEDIQRATLLHETLHACVKTIANEHPKDEEECVQSLEVALYSMCRDDRNAWLWEYLLSE